MIADLRTLVRAGPSHFVHNGELLLESMPFSFYGIRDKDTIVVVPAPSPEVPRWRQITLDPGDLQERVDRILNQETARETARLRDLMRTRVERKQRQMGDLGSFLELENREKTPPLRIDYPVPEAPSCDPLPSAWGEMWAIGRRTVAVADFAERPLRTQCPNMPT
jgi:hypothetical protein